MALRSALHAKGLRFRKDYRLDLHRVADDAPRRVRPDIVFPGLRLAVFVDGCFWHGCQEHRSLPASNAAFWKQKIEGTRQRDRAQVAWLEAAGWTVVRVWEHDLPEPALQTVVGHVERLRSDPVG